MKDDDKLKLARAIAAKVHANRHAALKGVTLPNQSCSHAELAQLIEAGEMDDCVAAQSALAAINALDPQLVEAVGLLQGVVDDYQSSESHHPDHILITKDVFDHISAFLAKQGDA